MQTSGIYENIQFDKTINIIEAASFPTVFPLHWHKYIEMILLPENAKISKYPVIRVQQTAYELHPGDLLFIWPGELHETVENSECQLIGLQFPVTIFNELPDFTPFLNIFRTFHQITPAMVPELAKSMNLHVLHIHSLQADRNTFSGVESLICLYELFIAFASYIKDTLFAGDGPSAKNSNRLIAKIDQACSYITTHCEQELTLDFIADYFGFSSCYFSRIFKQSTGYNFVEFLAMQRVKNAQMLLSDSRATITEVAYQSGFKSISTFNRTFRQYRGCSPREYKKYFLK